MKRKYRVISMIICLSLFAVLFSGCASDEISLMNAISKSASIHSMESKTDITLSFKTWGFADEEKDSMDQIHQMLDGARISVNQKLNQNVAKTNVRNETDIYLTAAGQKINSQFWTESNIVGKKTVVKEIIKLPDIVSGFLPPELSSKKYAVLDTGILPGLDSYDYQKMEDLSKNLAPKLVKLLQTFSTKFKPGFNSVTRIGNKTINGESLPVYELRLNDGSIKMLVKSAVNELLKNKDTIPLVKDFVKAMAEATGDKETIAEMNKSLKEFDKGKVGFLKEFNEAMDSFRMVRILSNKDLLIDFAIDKTGYIVNISGKIDISINMAEVEKAMNKISGMTNGEVTSKGVINLGLTFNTNISNINKNIPVTLPTLNSNNSFSLSKMMETMMNP